MDLLTTKQFINNKRIGVKLQKIDSHQNVIVNQQLECRICLQNMEKNEVQDICKCKGNVGISHEKCLLQWIKKSAIYKKNLSNYYYKCEICQSNIDLDTQKQVICKQEQNRFQNNIFFSLIMLLILLLGLGTLVLSIYNMAGVKQQQPIREIFFIGAGLSSLIIVCDTLVFLFVSFFQVKIKILGLKRNKFLKTKIASENRKVIPLVLKQEKKSIENPNGDSIINLSSVFQQN